LCSLVRRTLSQLVVRQTLDIGVLFYCYPGLLFSLMYSLTSHEHRFLLSGLKIEKKQSWTERQSAYLSAVKAFLTKIKPEFSELPVVFVKAIRFDPKLLLSVECAKAKQ